MERLEIGLIGVIAILALIGIRVPIGVAMGVTAFFGIWAMMGLSAAIGISKAIPFNLIGDWNLSAVPMFLFMGFVAVEAGLTRSLFGAARIFLARIPGGLASSTVFASALFGAASGSSVATSAAFSRIAVPEMLDSKYDPGLATGSVAASGTLAAWSVQLKMRTESIWNQLLAGADYPANETSDRHQMRTRMLRLTRSENRYSVRKPCAALRKSLVTILTSSEE